MPLLTPAQAKSHARIAGLLYLIIIVFGIGSEVVLRGPLVDLANARQTTEAILGAQGVFRLSVAADMVMAVSDVALAVLLFLVLRPVGPTLALLATVFRLVQAAILGMNLLNQHIALLLLTGAQDVSGLAPEQMQSTALLFLNAHEHGYDLGLVFFGVNSVLTGLLVWRSGFIPRPIGAGLMAAGAVYLTGSALRFLAPAVLGTFLPAYGLTIIAETAFCLWLLIAGIRTERYPQAAAV